MLHPVRGSAVIQRLNRCVQFEVPDTAANYHVSSNFALDSSGGALRLMGACERPYCAIMALRTALGYLMRPFRLLSVYLDTFNALRDKIDAPRLHTCAVPVTMWQTYAESASAAKIAPSNMLLIQREAAFRTASEEHMFEVPE